MLSANYIKAKIKWYFIFRLSFVIFFK